MTDATESCKEESGKASWDYHRKRQLRELGIDPDDDCS